MEKRRLGYIECQKRKKIARRAGLIRWLKWSEGKSREEISKYMQRVRKGIKINQI